MKFYLGVDGGQSRTKAWIGDEAGRVVGRGVGGPCNHVGAAEGAAKLTRAVSECVGKACEEAGLDFARVRFAAACFGMSGGPEDKEALLGRILRAERLMVTHDGMIALSGATAGWPGVIAIAGTGSFVFGRNAAGRTARAGGWGYIFGDEGSAFDIARQALRAALRYEEGWGPATSMRELLLEATGSESALDVLHRFYTDEYPRARVASLSSLVDRAATEGDEVAASIIGAAAQQLAILAASVRRQLWAEGEPALITWAGGVFGSAALLERFRLLAEMEPGARCRPPALEPVAGALLEAYRAAGVPVKLEA